MHLGKFPVYGFLGAVAVGTIAPLTTTTCCFLAEFCADLPFLLSQNFHLLSAALEGSGIAKVVVVVGVETP